MEKLEEAAMAGDVEAQLKLGIYYEDSDIKEALKWFKKSANGGSNDATYRVAEILMYDDDLKNEDMAIKFYKKAYENGDIRAMYELAKAYISSGNEEEGTELMLKCAEMKSADACMYLAKRFEWGFSQYGKDFNEVIRYYELALEYGEKEGGYSLALIYASGEYVPQNKNKARDYVNKAIKIGEDVHSLVKIYNLIGDLEDEIKYAKKYMASDPDGIFSNYFYARALIKSPISKEQNDAKKAYVTLRKLLESDTDLTEVEYYFLAEIYENGYGVDIDINKAKEFYKKASVGGLTKATEGYLRLNENYQKAENFLNYDIYTFQREKYTLYGISFSLEKDLEYYSICNKAANMLMSLCKLYYEEQYLLKIKDIKDYISNLPEILNYLNEMIPQGCCNWLSKYFQITVDEHKFYEEYLQEYIENDFGEPYFQILEYTLKTELGNANYDAIIKSVDIRADWITKSDGSLSGNAKALGKCILMNVGTDIAIEALKGISSALGTLWKDVKLALLFDKSSTKNAYLDIFEGKYKELIVEGMVSELKKGGIVSELYFPEFDGEGYFKKCSLDLADQGRKNLVYAIINDPFEVKYYDYALSNYGDENGELEFLAEKFDVNIQAIKENLSKEFYDKYCQNLHDYAQNRELFTQLLNFIHYPESQELKLYDARMAKDKEWLMLLKNDEQERKSEYIDILCAVLEVTFNMGDKKHYKKLKDGGKQFAEFISISEMFSFDMPNDKQFKKLDEEFGNIIIGSVKKGKKSYYKMYADFKINDDHTNLEELANKGFVWVYGTYAYDIREEEPIKALMLFDRACSFKNFSKLVIPIWVESIVNEQANDTSISEWVEKNAGRLMETKTYFVFDGQNKIRHSLNSEEVYGLNTENAVLDAISKLYSDMENGADIRYFYDIMKYLKEKYQKYCIEKIGENETIEVWLRRPLLKDIWEKVGNHDIIVYKLNFRVNAMDDDFGEYLEFIGSTSKQFVLNNDEVPLAVLANIKATHLFNNTVIITDKRIYTFDKQYHHDIIKIDIASIVKSDFDFVGDFVIVQNDGTKIKIEAGTSINKDEYKEDLGKVKSIITLIKNYDFDNPLPKLSSDVLKNIQMHTICSIKKFYME